MGCSYQIDKANGVVLTVWDGFLDAITFEALGDELRNDPDFDPGFATLTDLRNVTHTNLTSADMRHIAKHSPFDGPGRRAFLVGSDLMHGMSRVYQAFQGQEGETMRQFRDMEEARAWLGLPPK